MAIATKCPSCGRGLRAKDSAAGKKLKCPDCGSAVKVPGGVGGAAPRTPPPVAKQRPAGSRGAAKKRKKRAQPPAWRMPAMIGGGVGLVAVVALIAFLFLGGGGDEPQEVAAAPEADASAESATGSSADSSAETNDDATAASEPSDEPRSPATVNLAYVPPQAEAIAVIRVGDLWNSPLGQRLVQSGGPEAAASLEKMQQEIGLTPADFDAIVLASSDASQSSRAGLERAGPLPLPGGGGAGPADPEQPGDDIPGLAPEQESKPAEEVFILHTRIDYDREKLLAAADSAEPRDHGGTTYYHVSFEGPENNPGFAWFAGKRTIVMSETAAVIEAAIDRGSAPPESRPEFESFDAGDHVMLAIFPPAEDREELRLPEDPDAGPLARSVRDLIRSWEPHATGVGLALRASEGIEARVLMFCGDASATGSLREAARDVVQRAQQAFGEVQDSVPPAFRSVAEEAVSSLQVAEKGTALEIGGELPPSLFEEEKLAMLPMLIFSGLMSAGNPGDVPSPGVTFGSESPLTPPSGEKKPAPEAVEVVEGGLKKSLVVPPEEPFGVHVFDDEKLLVATLELTGEVAAGASAWGHLELKQATDDRGNPVTLGKPRLQFDDPTETFLELDRNSMFAGEFNEPKDTIRIHLTVNEPPAGAKQLARVQGSLKLRTGGEQKEVLLEGVKRKAGQTIEDPALEKAGLAARVLAPKKLPGADEKDADRRLGVEIAGAEGGVLADVDLVDARGESVSSGKSWFGSGESTTYVLESERPIPADARVKLTLRVGQKVVEVPFDFENVALPEKQE